MAMFGESFEPESGVRFGRISAGSLAAGPDGIDDASIS